MQVKIILKNIYCVSGKSTHVIQYVNFHVCLELLNFDLTQFTLYSFHIRTGGEVIQVNKKKKKRPQRGDESGNEWKVESSVTSSTGGHKTGEINENRKMEIMSLFPLLAHLFYCPLPQLQTSATLIKVFTLYIYRPDSSLEALSLRSVWTVYAIVCMQLVQCNTT